MFVFREIKRDSVFKGLNFTSHFSAHSAIFSRSALRSSAATIGSSTMIYRLVSSAKRRIDDPMSCTISFIKRRKRSGPSIEP